MHLLQFSQSIDSPSEIYVAFQWDPLLRPSLPPRQEGHSDTRVLGQMPSDPLWCISAPKSQIHCHDRTISLELFEIPHTRPELPASPAIPLAVSFSSSSSFFNSINNTKCKSLEQMLIEKKDRRRTGEDEEEGKQKEGGGKNTSGEQNNPAGPPLPLQASEVTLCFCEGACEQNGLWSWVTALYCGITTATTKPLQKCAGWL